MQITGKGKKERSIPVEPALELVIDRYPQTRADRHGVEALENSVAPLLVHYDGPV